MNERKESKYLVKTRSQAKSSGITLPEVHGVDKGIDPNILPEKQVIKPIITSEVKGITQAKPGLGQGIAVIKQKIKLPVPPLLHKHHIQEKEKRILQQPQNLAQPKITLKVPVPDSSQIHETFTPVPDYVIPKTGSGDDSNFRTIKRKTIQDISREIPTYSDPIYRPPPKPAEIPLQEIPRKLTDLDRDIHSDFKENSDEIL